MIRLIIGVVILVLLAVLVALNVGPEHTSSLNLFGYQIENVPIIAAGIAGFVLGFLYSLLVYLLRSIDRFRKAKLRGRVRELEERNKEQAENLKQAVKSGDQAVSTTPAGSEPKRRGWGRQSGRSGKSG
jgi:uncharacterized integral membrane protein